jgi:hypothetical protein
MENIMAGNEPPVTITEILRRHCQGSTNVSIWKHSTNIFPSHVKQYTFQDERACDVMSSQN